MQAELRYLPFPMTKDEKAQTLCYSEEKKKGEKNTQTLQDFLLPYLVEGTVSSTNNAFSDYIFPS